MACVQSYERAVTVARLRAQPAQPAVLELLRIVLSDADTLWPMTAV